MPSPGVRTLEELLGHGCYPSFDAGSRCWVLNFQDPDAVSEYHAAESARMACAAFQSFFAVQDDVRDVDRLPWALISSYYASYYAANSICRLLGSGCSFLNASRIGCINAVLDIYNLSERPSKGLHHINSAGTPGMLRLAPLGSSSGGSHDSFWRVFEKRIVELEEEVLTSGVRQAEAQACFLKLSRLRSVTNYKGKPSNWLSEMRNDLQYRHEHSAWFPSRMRKKSRERLAIIAAECKRNPLDISLDRNNDLERYVSAAAFMVSLCRDMMLMVSDRSSARKKSFADIGPIHFLLHRAS